MMDDVRMVIIKKQLYISFHFRRYGSVPPDMRSHRFKNE